MDEREGPEKRGAELVAVVMVIPGSDEPEAMVATLIASGMPSGEARDLVEAGLVTTYRGILTGGPWQRARIR